MRVYHDREVVPPSAPAPVDRTSFLFNDDDFEMDEGPEAPTENCDSEVCIHIIIFYEFLLIT
jgi:hypothetical protein